MGAQLHFFIGRRHGKTWLSKRRSWQGRAELVLDKLEKHQNLLIIGFRFLYGLHTVTPFAISMSDVSYLRFTLLNFIGAAIWATSIGFAGYYFGYILEAMIGDIKQYEAILMSIIIAIAILVWLIHIYRRYRSKHNLVR